MQKLYSHSQQAFHKAKQVIAGGVNSPVRAFSAVGGSPVFIHSAKGAYIKDIDGNQYIDFVGSFGPMIAGHAHPVVVEAVQQAVANGMSFGAPCEAETALASAICQRVPSIERLRFCNSGTEATMSAIRLARAFTGKSNILKFAGCYHGHSDGLLVAAGSGALTLGVPNSAGVPQDFAKHTLTAVYNDTDALAQIFAEHGAELACVIVEPIAGNMNCVLPDKAFLQTLRELCDAFSVVLIFDEVMTGFRVDKGGAQTLFNLHADLTTFGKVIGGGMPVGAFGGREDIMALLAPTGAVYQAGTLSGNPVAMAAGLAMMQLTDKLDFYKDLADKTNLLAQGIKQAAEAASVPIVVNSVCGMLGFFLTDLTEVRNFSQAQQVDTKLFSRFFHLMLQHGVYLAPSAFEAAFVSSAHSTAIIDEALSAFKKSFAAL